MPDQNTMSCPGGRPSRITIPANAHPLARLVFREMRKLGRTYEALEWDAGVLVSTFKSWRVGARPTLTTIDAALGALGWQLTPIKMDSLPAEMVRGLDQIRTHWAETEPQLLDILATVCLAPVIAEGTAEIPVAQRVLTHHFEHELRHAQSRP